MNARSLVLFGTSFTPQKLVRPGGAWSLDPSDLLAGWQDSAATTALYQPGSGSVDPPVGKAIDKSVNGNNASQATAGSRPTLSGRVNLLLASADASQTAWTKTNITLTGAKIQATASAVTELRQDATVGSGGSVVASFWVRKGSGATDANTFQLRNQTLSTNLLGITVNYDTGAITYATGVSGATMTPSGTGWLITLSVSGLAANTSIRSSVCFNGGTATAGVYAFLDQSDLRTSADAALGIPAYQGVRTVSDYDTAGFNLFDKFDGAASNLAATAGGGGTAGFALVAALKVFGGAGANRTLWSDAGTNTGRIVRINTSNQLEIAVGTGAAYTTLATVGTLAAGGTYVIAAYHDGGSLYAQINSLAIATAACGAATAGTAGFTIGKDNGAASGFAPVGVFQMMHLNNSCPPPSVIEKAKRYCGQKAGVFL